MPYVKSIPLRTTVNRSLSYILNPDKTENLLYTNAVNCLPNAKDAYLAMKWIYEHFSGEKYNAPLPKQGKGNVKAIHYILILSISLYTIFSKNTSFFETVAIFTERSGVNIATVSVK